MLNNRSDTTMRCIMSLTKKDLIITAFGRAKHAPPECAIPFVLDYISAGFPSAADDYVENQLDLNKFLIQHPAATFFIRVEGDSMINAGIHSGDLLVVDRALEVRHGRIVVAQINGEFTVKRIEYVGAHVYLVPENKNYKRQRITDEMAFDVWGVVTYVIHSV